MDSLLSSVGISIARVACSYFLKNRNNLVHRCQAQVASPGRNVAEPKLILFVSPSRMRMPGPGHGIGKCSRSAEGGGEERQCLSPGGHASGGRPGRCPAEGEAPAQAMNG